MSTNHLPTASPAAGPAPTKTAAAGPGQRQRPRRPLAADSSRQAKQRAAAILEVLAGVRSPLEAARALGVSLPRYYLLEDKALAGLLAACEPQPRGPRADAARRCAALERDGERWRRECARQQALLRAAQRALGLAPPPPAKASSPKRRPRRPAVRALQAIERLRAGDEPAAPDASTAAPVPS